MTSSGLVVVDKPGGMTSHDVVARIRRLAGTRRVGHAGTLDPMATGVLLVGVERATRLLGHLALTEKEYEATIRLGQATTTDDAEGEILPPATGQAMPGDVEGPAAGQSGQADRAAGIGEQALRAALAALTGAIRQVPPQISAIKVDGARAYKLARSGLVPELAARTVTVHELDLLAVRPAGDLLDLDVRVTCSSGTYIRAIARDLGVALGTGGHLTALRRTRVGPYQVSQARTLDQLASQFDVLPLGQVAAAAFPVLHLTAEQARQVSHGARLPAADPAQISTVQAGLLQAGPVAALDPDLNLVALLTAKGDQLAPLAVFVS